MSDTILSDFDDLMTSTRRTQQQALTATAIKNRLVAQDVIQNTGTSVVSISLPNTSFLTITNTVASTINSAIRIGAMPFQIALFQGSITAANLIPVVNPTGYTLTGPIAMPEISGIGTDGKNLVTKIFLYNNTGSTQTIYYVTETRFITGGGQAAG